MMDAMKRYQEATRGYERDVSNGGVRADGVPVYPMKPKTETTRYKWAVNYGHGWNEPNQLLTEEEAAATWPQRRKRLDYTRTEFPDVETTPLPEARL